MRVKNFALVTNLAKGICFCLLLLLMFARYFSTTSVRISWIASNKEIS